MDGFLFFCGLLLLIVLGILGIGQMIKGEYTDAETLDNGCVLVTTKYTNWYPSNDRVLRSRTFCNGDKIRFAQ